MKAISLWEPWATAIAIELKQIETRHWFTSYRGPVAIHAAKTREHAHIVWDPDFDPAITGAFSSSGVESIDDLPFGCVVCTANLVACDRVEGVRGKISRIEYALGNYDNGRFAWRLENVVRLAAPIPAKGSQGFWEWDGAGSPALGQLDLFKKQ